VISAEKMFKELARRFGVPILRMLRQPFIGTIIRGVGALMRAVPRPPSRVASAVEWSASLSSKPFIPVRFDPEGCGFVVLVQKGSVVGNNGQIVTPDGTILSDLSKEWFFSPEQHSLLFRFKLPAPTVFDGTTASLAVASGWNYYHWLIDVLPRIAIVEAAGIPVDRYIFNGPGSRFQRESLLLFGIPVERVLWTGRGVHYQCERLLVPNLPPTEGMAPEWVPNWLYNRMKPSFVARQPAKIYISRERAAYRRVVNDAEVVALLQEHGFTVVMTEEMSVADQIQLLHSAQAVVTPHGAALANIVFCEPGTPVIEFCHPQYVNPCFKTIARWRRLRFATIVGEGDRNPGGYEQVENDIKVPIDELRRVLKEFDL